MSDTMITPRPATAATPTTAESRFKLPPDLEVVVNPAPGPDEPRVRVEPEAGAKGRYVDVRG